MSKRLHKFNVTDPEALLEFCPEAIQQLDPVIKYRQNYAVIATLIEAAALTGQTVPGIELID